MPTPSLEMTAASEIAPLADDAVRASVADGLARAPVGGARDVDADLEVCRTMIRGGSKSFYAASLLLPERVRAPSYAIYAFCRDSDDEVDLSGGRMEAVARLRERLDRIYAGAPDDRAPDRALSAVAIRFALPKVYFEALLEGLQWDAEGRRYETFSELRAYAARVAGAVGAMMTALMGVRAPEMVARACDLGVAMQLTNIARDVGEDARAGRIYLPLDWLREAGVDPERLLADPQPSPELAMTVRRLLGEADLLYRRSHAGIARLPMSCRPAIWAARYIYAEIGREVLRNGCDSVTRRAVTSTGRKLRLLAAALGASVAHVRWDGSSALPECRYLAEAMGPAPRGRAAATSMAASPVEGPLGRTIRMFIDLPERDAPARRGAHVVAEQRRARERATGESSVRDLAVRGELIRGEPRSDGAEA